MMGDRDHSIDFEDAAQHLLSAHPHLDATPADVAAVLAACRTEKMPEGTVLCREGEVGDALFVLIEGRVQVQKRDVHGQVRPLGEVAAPSVLGQMAMIDRAHRSATCSAATPVVVARLDRDAWRTLARSSKPEGAALRRLILSSLTEQLLRGNARLSGLLADAATEAETVQERGLGGALLRASGLLEGWMSGPRR